MRRRQPDRAANGAGVIDDERKRAEQEREATTEFLRLVNAVDGTTELVEAAATFFQRQSGCEALGIRLKDGDDYPYYEARGFSREFILLENQLCRRDAAGHVVRDPAGEPVIECMCGNVICGRTRPGKPFFTSGGSFWANDTTRLLATTTDADRQTPTRNRCNGEGYESVALIPLLVGKERLGLLQLNDRRRGMFSPEVIALWERLAGYLAVALARSRSVEEVRRTERALRLSEARYRAILEQAAVGVTQVETRTGRFLQVNARFCDMLGYSRDEVLAGTWPELTHPDDLEANRAGAVRMEATGEPYRTEKRYLRKDGSVVWTSVTVSPVALPGEELATQVAIVEDITERKRAEEALRESDRRKTEFLAVLSHELRNPLAPIRNSIYLLERAPPGSGQAARAKAIIGRQTEHLTRLIDDLLDVTRISRGKVELQRARVDVREVVRKACEDLRSPFDRRGIDVRTETRPGPLWIEADAVRLAQVVGNLLHNAAKFTPEDRPVTVSVTGSATHAEIRVRDEGVGIAPDLLPRVFEPFVQADGGLARSKGGLGLGLALVKGLVEMHGGTVSARSEGLGRGSEFVVSLPLATTLARSAPAPIEAAATRAQEILVIEDNRDAAQSIAEVLEMEGHRVHIATDGRSGIAKARELKPDVVLCDIGLPDIDGYEVARTLRADEALRSTRLIALSGYAQPEDRRRAKEAGCDDHLPKPPALEVLLAAVVART